MNAMSGWGNFGDANKNPSFNRGKVNPIKHKYRIDNFTKKSEATKSAFVVYDCRFDKIAKDIEDLKQMVSHLRDKPEAIIASKINSLPSEKYELKTPIDVIIKIFADEAMALFPDLELYGEGKNEMEALNDLKLEIMDLLEDLEGVPEEELGQAPKAWKKTLSLLVAKCQ